MALAILFETWQARDRDLFAASLSRGTLLNPRNVARCPRTRGIHPLKQMKPCYPKA